MHSSVALLLALSAVFGLLTLSAAVPVPKADDWRSWLTGFGHDTYTLPAWLEQEMAACQCEASGATSNGRPAIQCSVASLGQVHWSTASSLTFCSAKSWLLEHMPTFDLSFLPPSVTVTGSSMLDDQIAFLLMAAKAAPWVTKAPLDVQFTYLLPYATYQESRVNWRPLFFAKYFPLVENASSAVEAMQMLIDPNTFLNWTGHPETVGPDPSPASSSSYTLEWSSDSSPPVLSPFDFIAYGYASCSGWAVFLTYVARAVGIPARPAGTPCWNTGPFAGLAKDNANVSQCWHGGSKGVEGGTFLNNHNWVEFWDDKTARWEFVNVPPGTKTPNAGLCNSFDVKTGCDYSPSTGCAGVQGPGLASQDHEIFAVTWAEADEEVPGHDGGPIVDARGLRLTDGEAVSPLVWSPSLASPLGTPLRLEGLRLVNRTDFYRCRPPTD